MPLYQVPTNWVTYPSIKYLRCTKLIKMTKNLAGENLANTCLFITFAKFSLYMPSIRYFNYM